MVEAATTMCPQCGSSRSFKNGARYTQEGQKVQRFLCRSCGFRFSEAGEKVKVARKVRSLKPGPDLTEPWISERDFSAYEVLNDASFTSGKNVASHDITKIGKGLYVLPSYNSKRRVCDVLQESKNLDTTTETKTVAGEENHLDIKGALLQFGVKRLTSGVNEETIYQQKTILLHLQRLGVDLSNPTSVWHAINKAMVERDSLPRPWSDGSKKIASKTYMQFCHASHITIPDDLNFKKWHTIEQKLPFIPTNDELSALIANFRTSKAAFLTMLMEIGARSGEAWRLRWIDLDLERGIVSLNDPEKHSLARQFKISGKLISMLNMIPKKAETVWPGDRKSLQQFRVAYIRTRNKVAFNLQNPRIREIKLHTFRHYYATMEYHRTKDILHVSRQLGHKDIKNTMIYTHLVDFSEDEYNSTTAKTQPEKLDLLGHGWEFICQDSTDGLMYFRKRK